MTLTVYQRAVRVLVSLYAVEAAMLVMLVGIYKAPAYDRTLLSTNAGVALVAGGVGVVAGVFLLARQLATGGRGLGKAFALGLTTNVVSGLLAFLMLEATVRIVAKRDQDHILVGSVLVRPTWPELRDRSHSVFTGATPWEDRDTSYFIYDRELGWTVAPNRHSPNGMYFSSVEGIRSGGPNVRMADSSAPFRVALVGDSNAMSFEVPYEESWGYYLQQLLGEEVQVLNFGVDGYGIDQMYLRYQRDVRPWNPQVVVVGFIGHDLKRTMVVYPFVSLGWTGYLVKPRFVMDNGELKLLNVPLPTPDTIFSASRIQSLPFVQYDLGYGSGEWEWRFDQGPLALRYMASAVPRWPIANPQVSEAASVALNSALLTRLIRSVERAGAAPLLVLLSPPNPLVRATLQDAHLAVLDGTACVQGIPDNLRFVPTGNNHYTGLANQAIARCTAPAITRALTAVGNSVRLRAPGRASDLPPQ